MITTGTVLSWTVTLAFTVETLPLLSVTVNTTVFGPTLVQSNDDLLIVVVAIPQLSEELLFTCTAVMVVEPAPLRVTVKSLASAIGFSTSLTVTVWVTVSVFPAASVTIQFTVVTPIG